MKKYYCTILLLICACCLIGCSNAKIPGNGKLPEQPNEDQDRQAVALVSDSFGRRMQNVSLLAPEEAIKQSINDNYSDLVSPALLAKWLNDPRNAPGRLVSSPWPDRIEVASNEKIAQDVYEVKGEIIEITSLEQTRGGYAAKHPIGLTVKKFDRKWLIDSVAVEPYEDTSATYNNTKYGFTFALPETWQGYAIVTTEWQGVAIGEQRNGQVVESGPIISIRHPQWTASSPRQDIPIMVFTLGQWNSLLKEEFSVGAAPIPPSELGRNSRYVLALPARYNYAFLTGFEEVEAILQAKPLKPTETFI